VHGSLARAGKVRGQTPKVAKQDKKKQPKGRAMKRIKYNRRFVTAGTHAADMLALRALRPCLRLPGGLTSGGATHLAHAGTLRQAAELTAAGRICGTRFPGAASKRLRGSGLTRLLCSRSGRLWQEEGPQLQPDVSWARCGHQQARALAACPDAVHEKRGGRLSFAHILPGQAMLLKLLASAGCPHPATLMDAQGSCVRRSCLRAPWPPLCL